MIVSLTAAAVALAVGLPIFALGERIRERGGADRHTSPTRKETTP
jgi:hypothetical protein|nr:MAG TPA: hypothetical protein [Caudoviricetes sp.]